MWRFESSHPSQPVHGLCGGTSGCLRTGDEAPLLVGELGAQGAPHLHLEACHRARGRRADAAACWSHWFRIANLDNGALDRLARNEVTLWRQIVQTFFALQTLKNYRARNGARRQHTRSQRQRNGRTGFVSLISEE